MSVARALAWLVTTLGLWLRRRRWRRAQRQRDRAMAAPGDWFNRHFSDAKRVRDDAPADDADPPGTARPRRRER